MKSYSSNDQKIARRKLEYNLVDHCNLACRECSHLSPFQAPGSGSLQGFKRDISRLSSVYHVDRFRFVGGEPLLHESIVEFINAVRLSRIANFIEIVTNGTLLSQVPDEVLSAADGVSVSWYPTSWKRESVLQQVKLRCQKHGVRFKVDKIDQFRKMQPPHRNTDSKLVSKVFRSCLIANTWDCQTFYDGYFYVCSRPIYTSSYYNKLGQETGDLRKTDGIYLHAPELRERIEAALQLAAPLESCKYCLGTVGKYQKWGQLSPKERQNPVAIAGDVTSSISLWRMRYLLVWQGVERTVLALVPSRRLQRALRILRAATIRD